MTTYATAAEAIEASAKHGEITRCANTPANLDDLLVECDDNVEADEQEFWGVDDDGDQWRVHVETKRGQS